MHRFDAAWNQTVNLHEFQSKKLFAGYGIPVPFGYAVQTAKEARSAAEDMGGDRWVVKAQAHTGGRGKAGGVVMVDSPDKVESESERILSARIVTNQVTTENRLILLSVTQIGIRSTDSRIPALDGNVIP